MSNPISRNAETRDLRNLEQETDNIYLSAIIISKRANQIAEKQKEELHNRLEPFINDSDNLEEIQENREQIEISMMYERMPKPTLMATQEFDDQKPTGESPMLRKNHFKNKKIIVGITGGIAAYKIPQLVRLLKRRVPKYRSL